MAGKGTDTDAAKAWFPPAVLGRGNLSARPGTTDAAAGGSAETTPSPTTHAIDLTTSVRDRSQRDTADAQEVRMNHSRMSWVVPGEKARTPRGKVPGSVRARADGTRVEPPANSGSELSQPPSSAKIWPEKRFDGMAQEAHFAVPNNFFSMLQSQDCQKPSVHPQMQKWGQLYRARPAELPNNYGGDVCKPLSGLCGQGFGNFPHVVENTKHQGLIVLKNFSFGLQPEWVAEKAQVTNQTVGQQLVIVESEAVAKPAAANMSSRVQGPQSLRSGVAASELEAAGSSSRKRAQPPECSQRKEKHNSKERDRRRKIRLSCDELNTLVPFCSKGTDKATTLQWTTTFLKYIRDVYGDAISEDFQSMFSCKTGLYLKPVTPSGQLFKHQEAADTPGIRTPVSDNRRSDTRVIEPGLQGQAAGHERKSIGPHVTRFRAQGGSQSSLLPKPIGPAPDLEGQPNFRIDRPHNQPIVRALKHKTPLLPTPTDCLIRFPNRVINKPDAFNKIPFTNNSPDSHGREVNRTTNRLLQRGKEVDRQMERKEVDKGSGGTIGTPVDVSSGGAGENKKEDSENDKHIGRVLCEVTSVMDCDRDSKKADEEPAEKRAKIDNPDTCLGT